jgi:type IV secretion system protein TrbL
LRSTGDRVADGLAERFAVGERGGWTATGGSPIGESAESTGRSEGTRVPGWAQQLRREQVLRGVERLSREGEASGAGLKQTLRGDQE